VNTNLAAAAGALVALLIALWRTKKWDLGMALNGAVVGLVAITAPCAWVEGWAAIVIGAIAGAVMYAGVHFFDLIKIDDPVGAISVHGIGGAWGLLSLGLFADGTYGSYAIEAAYATGLFYGGGWGQLIAQVIGIVVVFVWAFGLGYIVFKVLDKMVGIRVSRKEELQGLDIPEHGMEAYGGFQVFSTM